MRQVPISPSRRCSSRERPLTPASQARASYFDAEAVPRQGNALIGDLALAGQHGVRHMREQHAFGADAIEFGGDAAPAQMKARSPIELVALHDVEIGVASGGNQAFYPFAVAGEGDDLAFELEAQGVGRRARGMLGLEGRHVHAVDVERRGGEKLDELQIIAAWLGARAGKQGFCGADKTRGDAGRPNDGERLGPLAHVLGVDEPPHEPGVVVAMQMRDEDRLDRVRVETATVEADQHGSAAVDEKAAAGPVHLVAGLQAATGAEGITAPDDCELHDYTPAAGAQAFALGLFVTSSYHLPRFLSAGGRSMRAGFMKSIATRPVMSATE